jgi:hypothetical protein
MRVFAAGYSYEPAGDFALQSATFFIPRYTWIYGVCNKNINPRKNFLFWLCGAPDT